MAIDDNILVIGVSSRALVDMEKENEVFLNKGIDAYRKYQLEKEDVPLKPGTAFPLIRNLLLLNSLVEKPLVEVVVMSKNSPETGIRMLNSIRKMDLNITRIALSGGTSLAPYIEGFRVDLFLSKDEKDVQDIIDFKSCAAGLIYNPPGNIFEFDENEVRLAFDADAVIFSEESELRYKKEGLASFIQHESENEKIPLSKGPFADLLKKLSGMQKVLNENMDKSPLRLAIVTARSAPSHMRVINTLREWGVVVDEAYFLGGLAKDQILKAFGAHIFFDDQEVHLDSSSMVVPAAKVPYPKDSELNKMINN